MASNRVTRRTRVPTPRASRRPRSAPRAELLHVFTLPDSDAIGTFWGHPGTRTFGDLLIDLEEDKAARAVVFGLVAGVDLAPRGIHYAQPPAI